MKRLPSSLVAASLWLSLLLANPLAAQAQANPFEGGWLLQAEGSSLGFQSVKNDTKVEQSGFASFSGAISSDGIAEIRVALDSVDTKVDLRNVRMRFLFFETFTHPEAIIMARIDPAFLADLPAKRRISMSLPYSLSLHGVTQDRTADVTVTMISEDLVNVASVGMIPVAAEDFDLTGGITKLQETASVKIMPMGSVTFDFLFQRGGTAQTAVASDTAAPADTALEAEGDFDTEACLGRFEILSRAGNINFRSGSARLDVAGSTILNNLNDIVSRCPGMVLEVGGHTDDLGSDATNLDLSEKRAASVIDYLVAKGIDAARLSPKGYGETTPLLANDTDENRARNRRIEFKVLP